MNQNSILKRAIERKQSGYVHQFYNMEKFFIAAIESGDIETLSKLCNYSGERKLPDRLTPAELVANDCANAIRFIDTGARIAIQHHVDYETACSLAEILIYDISLISDRKALYNYVNEGLALFIRLISEAAHPPYSFHVEQSILYIQKTIYENLSVKTIAEQQNVNPDYLSSLFKKEVGLNLSKYIMKEKINEARLLFAYSSYSVTDVATMLSFSYTSHFSTTFKKFAGMTPKEYLEKDKSIGSITKRGCL